MDKDLKNILDDLEDEGIETFNRKYFKHHDSSTPLNTPSNKTEKANGSQAISSFEFSKYFENIDEKAYEKRHEKTYCNKTYVGGSQSETSLCNNLLCSKCDTKVSIFKEQRWCDTCDYLFFRNNYGNLIKLTEKLIGSPGTTCYSCQCSWINIDGGLRDVDLLPNIMWSCNGHN